MLGRPPALGASAAQDAAQLPRDVLPRHALGLVAVEATLVFVDRRPFLKRVADLAESRRVLLDRAATASPLEHRSAHHPRCRVWCRRALRLGGSMPAKGRNVKGMDVKWMGAVGLIEAYCFFLNPFRKLTLPIASRNTERFLFRSPFP